MPVNCRKLGRSDNENHDQRQCEAPGAAQIHAVLQAHPVLNPLGYMRRMRLYLEDPNSEAVGWFQYLPEKGCRSAVDRVETSWRRMVFRAIYQTTHQRCQVTTSERLPCWWHLQGGRKWISVWATDINLYPLRKGL